MLRIPRIRVSGENSKGFVALVGVGMRRYTESALDKLSRATYDCAIPAVLVAVIPSGGA